MPRRLLRVLLPLDRRSGPAWARSSRRWSPLESGARVGRLLMAILCFSLGCLNQDVDVAAPVITARDVTVRVLPDSQYPDVAQALGWVDGVPDVEVLVRRLDSAATPVDSGRTSDNGITVGPLAAGRYRVSVFRGLTPSERSSLAGGSFEGLALETEFDAGRADSVTIMGLGATRGSLLTSEWFFAGGWYGEYPYDHSGYWELYNNSDTTIYLDGLLLAQGHAKYLEGISYSCVQFEKEFLSADGVWARRFDRFPGNGMDYPLPAGQVALVAGYAIDHRPIFPNALDLRDADFEFGSESGVNNPDVPNLEWLGPERFPAGQIFASNVGVPMIVLPLDPETLPVQFLTASTSPVEFRKVPLSHILDVFAWMPTLGPRFTPCRHMLGPAMSIDVETGRPVPDSFLRSTNRRVIGTTADGRKVLLRTRSSATDFEDGPRTPGTIPY